MRVLVEAEVLEALNTSWELRDDQAWELLELLDKEIEEAAWF